MTFVKITKRPDIEKIKKYELQEIVENSKIDFKLYTRILNEEKLESIKNDFPEVLNVKNLMSLKAIKLSLEQV